MKRVKISLFTVILSVIVVVVFQNQDFFMNKQMLNIDLYFIKYTTPFLPNIAMFFACFVIGLTTSFISYLSFKVKSEKVIKLLRSREASLLKLVSSLRQELDKIKTSSSLQGPKKFNVDGFDKDVNKN